MRALPLLLVLAAGQIPATTLDITTLTIGTPAKIAEIDLGKLKGDLRRLSWAPDGTRMCVQTAEGERPAEKTHTYVIALVDGALSPVDAEPDWASAYWTRKSDRYAPGLPSIEIGVDQKRENVQVGTGSAGALDRESSGLGAGNVNSPNNIDRAANRTLENTVRLTVFGTTIAEFVNARPVPGLTFGWGPDRAAAIAFVDRDGRLFLLDSTAHRRAIADVKDAILPAWTTDGSRLAYLQKTGRKKYALMIVSLQTPAR